jgi:type IV secretory pathway VirB10-like protein
LPFNPKTIAFSVAALMAVAAGAYTLMPNDEQSSAAGQDAEGLEQAAAKAEPTDTPKSVAGNSGANADAKEVNAPPVQQPSAQNQPVVPAPKKLTTQQLTPPIATEEEKLQKAAEQESNFYGVRHKIAMSSKKRLPDSRRS